jgi:multiple antibiotic resistance protein
VEGSLGFLKYLVSLLVITDPLFAAILVAGFASSADEVKRIARRASLTVLIASLITLAFGETFLGVIGVNIYSIKIFGGLILLHMAFQMLQAHQPRTKHTEKEQEAISEKEDISIIPIGIPVLFGPGTFTTMLIFREEAKRISGFVELSVAVLITILLIYLTLKNSLYISRRLGATGTGVLKRIFGLFTGALGSQFVVDGIKHLWVGG